MTELKLGDPVKIIQGRYTNKTGTYVRALSCGRFHIINLGKGIVTLAPREWFKVVEVESKKHATID